MNKRLQEAVADVCLLLDDIVESVNNAESPSDRLERAIAAREVRAELLEAWDEAKAEQRSALEPPQYATLKEAVQALRTDPNVPRDVSEEQLRAWAAMLVRKEQP